MYHFDHSVMMTQRMVIDMIWDRTSFPAGQVIHHRLRI
jgi:hypothetical protein